MAGEAAEEQGPRRVSCFKIIFVAFVSLLALFFRFRTLEEGEVEERLLSWAVVVVAAAASLAAVPFDSLFASLMPP